MKLYLARHGEYVTHDIQKLGALSDKGRRDIECLAKLIQPLRIQVAHIFHSGKTRAEQTAQLLASAFISSNPWSAYSGINPEDDVAAFAEVVNTLEEDVLVVGHLPFMARLTNKLLINNENHELVFFHPGTLLCLERLDHERWVIQWLLNPSLVESRED
jgi:phosphohistidine phosphatase